MKKTFKKKVIVIPLLLLGVLSLALYFLLNQASNQVPEDFGIEQLKL